MCACTCVLFVLCLCVCTVCVWCRVGLIGQSHKPNYYTLHTVCVASRYVTICTTYSSYCPFSIRTNLLFTCCATPSVFIQLLYEEAKWSITITVERVSNVNKLAPIMLVSLCTCEPAWDHDIASLVLEAVAFICVNTCRTLGVWGEYL